MTGKFIHHHSAPPVYGHEGDEFNVIETDEGISIYQGGFPIESCDSVEEAERRADELAEEFDKDVLTLDVARDAFDISPGDRVAAIYLNEAAKYHRDGMIEDDTFRKIVQRVAEWLADDFKLDT